MSPDRSTRALAALPALAVLATLGCGGGAPAHADSAAAATTPATAASSAEADAMAPPPAADLVHLAASMERATTAALPPGTGHEIVTAACVSCHSATMLTQQHKDSAAWTKTVTQMVAWGAPVPPARQPVLVAYLAEHWPARGPGPTPASKP